jgi:hypothetical protein
MRDPLRRVILRQLAQAPSAKHYSVHVECMLQNRRGLSEPTETNRWQITPPPASMPLKALHMALWSPFQYTPTSGLQCKGWSCPNSTNVPSTLSWRRVRWCWEDMILPGCKNPRNWVDAPNVGKCEWEQMLGTIECIFLIWQDEIKMSYCLSFYTAVSRIYTQHRPVHLRYPGISVHPESLLNDIHGGHDRTSLGIHFEPKIKWTERCTWRLWSI